MSERSDEYELSIDQLPPLLDQLDVNFDYGNFITNHLPIIDVPYLQHPEERITDNIVAPTRLGLLINRKIKSVFDSLEIDNIQYFPARLIERNTGEVGEGYCVANIVGKYACVDFDESEIELYDDGEIEFIDSLKLKTDDNGDYGHIFRLGEFPPVIIISNYVKEALIEAKVTGFNIYEPKDFSL